MSSIALTVNGQATHGRCRSCDAAAVCPQRRPCAPRAEIRMRPWSVRLLHGDRRPARRSIVRHAGELVERRRGDHARRARHTGEAPSDSEGLHRRAGGAVRILPVGRHHDRRGALEPESESHQSRHPTVAVHCALSMLRTRAHAARHHALRRGETRMSPTTLTTRFHPHVWRAGGELQQCRALDAGLPSTPLRRRPRAVRHPRLAHRSAAARFVDCRQRRRHGHGIHREVRARSRHAHRADAARRRRAVGARSSASTSSNAIPRRRPIRERPRAASRRRRTSTRRTSRSRRQPRERRCSDWRRRDSTCPSID